MNNGNAQQFVDWNGRSGERWVADQIQLDRMLDALGNAAIEAIAPADAEHLLDIGCGAGAASLAIGARVGSRGRVLGVDISEPLLNRARTRVPDGVPVTFMQADASRAPLPVGEFDCLFSRFGVMFFDDPVAAFSHMRAALKPGGRMGFVCWRPETENEWIRFPYEAVEGFVPPPPPFAPDAPGPFSFSDRERVSRILTSAGFRDVAFQALNHDMPIGEGATQEEAVEQALGIVLKLGALARALNEQPDAMRERASVVVRDALMRRAAKQAVRLEGAVWVVTAHNPVGE